MTFPARKNKKADTTAYGAGMKCCGSGPFGMRWKMVTTLSLLLGAVDMILYLFTFDNCIILINPEQVHDGHSASESGWKYRAIYPLAHLLESALAELSARNMGTALFCEPVVSDRLLANQLRGLFNLIQYSETYWKEKQHSYQC